MLLSIPQIAIFGWLIPEIGFPITLLLCALISLSGVLVTKYALGLEKPLAAVSTAAEDVEIVEIVEESEIVEHVVAEYRD